MSFEKAAKQKLRFTSADYNGTLNSEDLWDISLDSLDTMAQTLRTELKESSTKSFIRKANKKDATIKLRFDIVKRVIEVKLEAIETAEKSLETKQHNSMIREKIAAAKSKGLDNLSVKELEKLLK